MTIEIPPIISVDDHVVEPRDLWQRWLPARHRSAGPKVVRAHYEPGPWPVRISDRIDAELPMTDFWIYEDVQLPVMVGMASAGLRPDQIVHGPISYDEMRPGCWSLPLRLADMDVNGVERALCFPTFPRFCGQTFLEARDRQLALACVEAYNNWMVDEWCGDSGGRLIPLCLIPLWDAGLAAREVRRNASRGVRAVAFSELPSALGLASVHDGAGWWDPFFSACAETGTVICIHVGSSSQTLTTSPDAPMAVRLALLSVNSQLAMTDWLVAGILARFPGLKLAFSESQIGWMPYVFERVDTIWRKGNAQSGFHPALVDPPSSYVAGRVYGCFFEDDFGLRSYDSIGIDQITFESDYPHQDSTWPNTRGYAARAMAHLTPEQIYKMVRGNAITMLDLPMHLPGA